VELCSQSLRTSTLGQRSLIKHHWFLGSNTAKSISSSAIDKLQHSHLSISVVRDVNCFSFMPVLRNYNQTDLEKPTSMKNCNCLLLLRNSLMNCLLVKCPAVAVSHPRKLVYPRHLILLQASSWAAVWLGTSITGL